MYWLTDAQNADCKIHEKCEWFLMTAAPPSSGVLQKQLPPCHTAKKKRLEVLTILPEPPQPKDAKSVEKPGRGIILVALEFFHISWLLMTCPINNDQFRVL